MYPAMQAGIRHAARRIDLKFIIAQALHGDGCTIAAKLPSLFVRMLAHLMISAPVVKDVADVVRLWTKATSSS